MPVNMLGSVPSAELAMVPAHHLLRDDLEHHALRRARRRSRLDRRRIRLSPRPRLERRPDGGFDVCPKAGGVAPTDVAPTTTLVLQAGPPSRVRLTAYALTVAKESPTVQRTH